jgi:hypothetical protein
MVDLAESQTPLRSTHGELSFSPLRDERDAIRNILVRVSPTTTSRSSRPPSTTTRPLPMEWVLGRDPDVAAAIGLAQKLAAMSLPLHLIGERGTGLETLALNLAATRSHEGPILRFDASEELFGRPDAKGGVLVVGHLDELESRKASTKGGSCSAGATGASSTSRGPPESESWERSSARPRSSSRPYDFARICSTSSGPC